MAQTEINSLFTNGGIPATGISGGFPTIRIWEIDGNAQTLIVGSPDGIMSEIVISSPGSGDGFYTFLFDTGLNYDQTKKYLIRIDGGPTLSDTDRYQVGEIEPSALDEVLVPDHIIPGSAGETLTLIKADTTKLFLDVQAVNDIVSLILQYDTNRTKIDKVAKTLTIYEEDCTTPLRVFQLIDSSGTPSIDEVCERKPISANDSQPTC